MSYLGQNINVANSTPSASVSQVGLTPYATTVETFFGVEAGKAVTPHGLGAALNFYGVMQADQRQATAWVNFDGTGTVAIRDAYNVSSITDNGTGDYTINFTAPMNNANYSFIGQSIDSGNFVYTPRGVTSKNTSSLRMVFGSSSANADYQQVSIQVFGGK